MDSVVSPIPGYNGRDPQDIVFIDGVAEVDAPAVVERYRAAGFGINDDSSAVQLGTALRDASVDPRAGDVAPRPDLSRRRE